MVTSHAPRSAPISSPKLVAVETPRRRAEQLLARIEAEGRWLRGPQRASRLARLSETGAELHDAMAWCASSEIPEARRLALRLAAGAWWAWFQLGRIAEARRWLETVLEDGQGALGWGSSPDLVCLEARIGAGWLAFLQGDFVAAEGHLEVAVTAARGSNRSRSIGLVLGLQSQTALAREDFDTALRLATEATEQPRLAGDAWGLAVALGWLGDATRAAGDRVEATRLYASSLNAARAAGDPWLVAASLASLGRHGADAAAMPARPAKLVDECLALGRELGERWVLARGLDALAAVVERGGERGRAIRVRTGADALREAAGVTVPPFDRPRASFATRRTPPAPVLIRSNGAAHAGSESNGWERPGRSVPLRVTTLGSFAIQVGDRQVLPAEWGYAKPRDLFFFLLDGGQRTKEEVGQALWPNADAAQLRGNFHVALHRLRRVLGDPGWVVFAGDRYEINRAWTVQYDVSVFEAKLMAAEAAEDGAARALLREAISLYTGDYLPGVRGEWAVARRVTLRGAYEAAVRRLGALGG